MATTVYLNPYLPEAQYANYRRLRRLLEDLVEDLPDGPASEVQVYLDDHCAYCGKPLQASERLQGDGLCMKHSYEQIYNLVFALHAHLELEVVTC